MPIFVKPFPVDNGKTDYMVVVKPHPGTPVNRFAIRTKKAAREYAAQLANTLGQEVQDLTKA